MDINKAIQIRDDFANDIKGIESPDALLQKLLAVLEQFGFTQGGYTSGFMREDETFHDLIIVDNLTDEWKDTYIKMDWANFDYVNLHCAKSLLPLQWSKIYDGLDRGIIDQKYKTVANACDDFGFRNGFSIALANRGTFKSGAGFIYDRDLSADECEKLFSDNQFLLTNLLYLFHNHLDRGFLGVQHFNLSHREIEVVKWLSDGLRVKNIAHHLSTSPHTVEKQIASARQKLSAATNAQAVARAVSAGII